MVTDRALVCAPRDVGNARQIARFDVSSGFDRGVEGEKFPHPFGPKGRLDLKARFDRSVRIGSRMSKSVLKKTSRRNSDRDRFESVRFYIIDDACLFRKIMQNKYGGIDSRNDELI